MFVVKKSQHNPLIGPIEKNIWESKAAFNGCPARIQSGKKNILHIVYRAIGPGPFLNNTGPAEYSVVGTAETLDGIKYCDRHPLITPEFIWENFGCEDPRVTLFEGTYYIFYTALSTYPFSPQGIRVAVAKTKDFKTVEEKHLVTPFNAKAMALFPERIGGKMAAILTAHTDVPPSLFTIAYFDKEEDLWNEDKWKEWEENAEYYMFDLRRSPDDQIEAGAPPIKTPYGWLLIYSHIQHYFSDHKLFGIEAILLDLNDPHSIIGRTRGPIITPTERYEIEGEVRNITFPSGAELIKNTLHIYYGGADTVCAKAEVNIDDLAASMIPHKRANFIIRSHENPILIPNQNNTWEAKAVFNPAAIDINGTVYILYRSMSSDNTSYVGLATSKNGINIDTRLKDPIYKPRADFESKRIPDGNSGCEDPRIVEIDNKLYMTYTAYNGIDVPRVAISSIDKKDFLEKKWNWSEPVLVTIPGIDDKDASIIPEKTDQGYLFIHRINGVICGTYVPDLDFTNHQVNTCIEIMGPRPGLWDSKRIGISGPPIKTPKGWLLFYHGISENGVYRLGVALLDKKDPTKVISRATDWIMEPETDYELYGQVGNVVFPCGQIIRNDTVYLYYGGADSVVGVATVSLSRLLEILN